MASQAYENMLMQVDREMRTMKQGCHLWAKSNFARMPSVFDWPDYYDPEKIKTELALAGASEVLDVFTKFHKLYEDFLELGYLSAYAELGNESEEVKKAERRQYEIVGEAISFQTDLIELVTNANSS